MGVDIGVHSYGHFRLEAAGGSHFGDDFQFGDGFAVERTTQTESYVYLPVRFSHTGIYDAFRFEAVFDGMQDFVSAHAVGAKASGGNGGHDPGFGIRLDGVMASDSIHGRSRLETVQGLLEKIHVIEVEWGPYGTEFLDKSVSHGMNQYGGFDKCKPFLNEFHT